MAESCKKPTTELINPHIDVHMARRKKYEGLNPFVAAGLIKFSEEGELEKIKFTPQVAIAISIAVILAILALNLILPPV
jgi:preprotein translocase subunit Sec61beta